MPASHAPPPAAPGDPGRTPTGGELLALHNAAMCFMYAWTKHRAISVAMYEQACDLAAGLRERPDDPGEADRRAGSRRLRPPP
jgi:hypothetical protein